MRKWITIPVCRRSEALKKLAKARRRMVMFKAGGSTSDILTDTLQDYKSRSARYFGFDLEKRTAISEPKVEKVEKDGKKFEKRTAEYEKLKVTMYQVNPFADSRLAEPETADGAPPKETSQTRRKLATENDWQEVIVNLPWSMETRREKLADLLEAKAHVPDGHEDAEELRDGAMAGLWELATNPENHAAIPPKVIPCVLQGLYFDETGARLKATRAAWAFASSRSTRLALIEAGVTEALMEGWKTSLKQKALEDPELNQRQIDLQAAALGTIAILATDKAGRDSLVKEDDGRENFLIVLQSCGNLPDCDEKWGPQRRTLSAQILGTVLSRDGDVALLFAQNQQVKSLVALLQEEFGRLEDAPLLFHLDVALFLNCGLSAAMQNPAFAEEVVALAQAKDLVAYCLDALKKTLNHLSQAEAGADRHLRLCKTLEDLSQTLWSAVCVAAAKDHKIITQDVVEQICGLISFLTSEDAKVENSRVVYHLVGALANIAASPDLAKGIFGSMKLRPVVLESLSQMCAPETASGKPLLGHIRVAACAGLAFLASHPSEDDICRSIMCEAGVFETVAASATVLPSDPQIQQNFQDAVSAVMMYLSSAVGAIEKEQLLFLIDAAGKATKAEAALFFVCTLWFFLTDPENRDALTKPPEPEPEPEPEPKPEGEDEEGDAAEEAGSPPTEENSSDDPEAQPAGKAGEEGKDEEEGEQPEGKGDEEAEEEEPAETPQEVTLQNILDIGEKWTKELGSGDAEAEAAITKLLEFVVCCVWIFLIPEETEASVNDRVQDVYAYHGGSWWTTPVQSLGSTIDVYKRNWPSLCDFLYSCLDLELPRHCKIQQLAIGCLWNLSTHIPIFESRMVLDGIHFRLHEIALDSSRNWSLRDGATSFLLSLSDFQGTVDAMGGNLSMLNVLVELLKSEVPVLESRSALGLARMCCKPPIGSKNPKADVKEIKKSIASLGAIESLIRVMSRAFQLVLGEAEMPREEPIEGIEPIVVDPAQMLFSAAVALQNLSVLASNQKEIASRCLMKLLRIQSFLCEKSQLSELEIDIVDIISSVLQNLSLHPDNRTKFYKAELRGSVAKQLAHGDGNQKSRKNRQQHSEESQGHSELKVLYPRRVGQAARKEAGPEAENLGAKARVSENVDERRGGGKPGQKTEFISWMQKTFQAGEEQLAQEPTAEKERLPTSADGDEESTRQNLSRLYLNLRKPQRDMWQVPDRYKKFIGKARWAPPIKEYREVKGSIKMPNIASRLLETGKPKNAADALRQMKREARENGELKFNETVTDAAPPLEQTLSGKIPVAMLQADTRGSTPPEGVSRNRKQGAPPLSLEVVLTSDSANSNISFNEANASFGSAGTKLTMFEHIKGSKLSEGLFPSYRLPNGLQAHYYYAGGKLVDEIDVPSCVPPKRPDTMMGALQLKLPMTRTLNVIRVPPGTAGPNTVLRPVPTLCPLPNKHTLEVQDPSDLSNRAAFGKLVDSNTKFTLTTEKVVQQETILVELVPEVAKVPWSLPKSIFRPRVKECESRGYFDSERVKEKSKTNDWDSMLGKEKFRSMLIRENKNVDQEVDFMLNKLKRIFSTNWYILASTHTYYCCQGNTSPYGMSLNAYTSFLDECGIPDPDSQSVRRPDLDTIFSVANLGGDTPKEHPDAVKGVVVANKLTLTRAEFIEAIMRIGIAKYGRGVKTHDVSEAVKMLFDENIVKNLPKECLWVSNDFLTNRLYFQEVDEALKKHKALLEAIYKRYCLRPPNGGLRSKRMMYNGFVQFIEDTSLVSESFSVIETKLAFLWSRMQFSDEYKDALKVQSLTFVDFLEALGIIADRISLPTANELEQLGYASILEWHLDRDKEQLAEEDREEQGGEEEGGEEENEGGEASGASERPKSTGADDTEKTRPLAEEVADLLNLVFHRLYYKQGDDETMTLDMDELLKEVKKRDKDLGS